MCCRMASPGGAVRGAHGIIFSDSIRCRMEEGSFDDKSVFVYSVSDCNGSDLRNVSGENAYNESGEEFTEKADRGVDRVLFSDGICADIIPISNSDVRC